MVGLWPYQPLPLRGPCYNYQIRGKDFFHHQHKIQTLYHPQLLNRIQHTYLPLQIQLNVVYIHNHIVCSTGHLHDGVILLLRPELVISDLTNGKQFAIVNGCTSQSKNVCCGVPQGSLLGPRFFSYCVNNLPDAVTEGELAMYADDTTFSVVGDNVEVVIDKLNKALTSINLCCRNNKLTIYTGKSEVMILTHKLLCVPLKPLMLGNKVLAFVTETKCLIRNYY